MCVSAKFYVIIINPVVIKLMLQHAVIEAAISRHFACKEVRSLGHGSVGSLLKYIEKHRQHQSREPAVFYETALVARQLYVNVKTF